MEVVQEAAKSPVPLLCNGDDDRLSLEADDGDKGGGRDGAASPPPEKERNGLEPEEDEHEEETPKIFLRPFSEIREEESEEEEDDCDDVVFVGEGRKEVDEEVLRERRLEEVRVRLGQICTWDCERAGVEMGFSCHGDLDVVGGGCEKRNKLLSNAAGKLSMWLSRRSGSNNVIVQQLQQQPNYSIQQVRQQPHPPPPVNMINGNRLISWSPQQQQQQQQLSNKQGGNNVRMSLQQQQFTQLFFDPAKGLLLCPQQQGGGTTQQIRLANGMIVQTTQQQQHPHHQAPPRIVQPTAPPQLRMVSRPSGNPRQQTASQQYRAQLRSAAPPPVVVRQQYQPPPPPVRMIRPMQQRMVNPVATPPPLPPPPPVVQRNVNGVVPVKLPMAGGIVPPVSSSAAASSGPPAKGSVTAGNQKPIPGTVEENDSDLQNKTFPSLVVQVKTCLGSRGNKAAQTKARSDLDASVKSVLVNTPSQFTEWLMRKGLLRLDHACDTHKQPLKLGMYSDTSRQPFSGGYVWTSECCAERQISVFSGSIFEGSKYPPGTVLKLVYHWACQTPANNVLQWVKVSSLYLKNFFTLLRAVCIAWLHEMCPPLGGEMRYVEIGVITLGSSAETSRGVKNVNVEILGVFDPLTKIIRMKVINSMQGVLKDKSTKTPSSNSTSEQGARAFQILWPLTHWVDKRSVLLIDGIIDKALFHELGFKNIQQCNSNGGGGGGGTGAGGGATNMNVMNYLRNLVPKMFSSTLSVLSKSIVQQFLDELSWREMYGSSVLLTYDNVLEHIAKMTKWTDQIADPLITRFNRINQNPFIDWSNSKQTRRCPLNTIPLSLRNEPGIRECIRHVMKEDGINKGERSGGAGGGGEVARGIGPIASIVTGKGGSISSVRKQAQEERNATVQTNLRYYKAHYERLSIKELCLQGYYYGRRDGGSGGHVEDVAVAMPSMLKCPLCVKTFTTNTDIPRHIYSHVTGSSGYKVDSSICYICLKDLPTGVSIGNHISQVHKLTNVTYPCKICEERFKSEEDLTIHMWDLHHARETPYKCGVCGYATAFHHDVIQHFIETHPTAPTTLCPTCLKPFPITSPQALKSLITHFQSHTNGRRSKPCPRCTLHFPTDTDLDNHLLYHFPNDTNSSWQPHQFSEPPIPMAQPPPTKTPIPLSMSSSTSYFDGGGGGAGAPPQKKQKVVQKSRKGGSGVEVDQQQQQYLKKSTLNVSISVPIDTNEKYGGSKYAINVPLTVLGEEGELKGGDVTCGECCREVAAGHFIGKLICTKCRYITSCHSAMELHHAHNHNQQQDKQIKPVMKTNPINLLDEELCCKKCGGDYSSTNPYLLATHMSNCESLRACPKSKLHPNKEDEDVEEDDPTKPPDDPQEEPTPQQPTKDQPTKHPTFDLLSIDPSAPTTFEDMLSLDASNDLIDSPFMMPPLSSTANQPFHSPVFGEPQTPCPAPSSNNNSGGGGGGTTAQLGDWDGWDGCISSLLGSGDK